MKCVIDDKILSVIGTRQVCGSAGAVTIAGVTSDSRIVKHGDAFVAISGTKVDGHAFILDAIRAGAALVVCEKAPDGAGEPGTPPVVVVNDARNALSVLAAAVAGNPTEAIELTAVIGTDGKTSTTMIIESGLKGCGRVTGLLGTVQYRYAGKVIDSNMTTPDPVALQNFFADMRTAGVEAAVMEVSSHAIDQRRVESCRFKCAVFTNLGRDHLDYHKTIEAYREAKVRFFTEVLPLNPGAVGAVVNDDDPVAAEIRKRCPLKVIGWTLTGKPGSELRLMNVAYSFDGTVFDVETPWGVKHVQTRLIGQHNVANIIAAIGVAGLSGWDIDRFIDGVEALNTIPGRLERVVSTNPRKVFVDYAHTPRAIESVLKILRGIGSQARLHIVCGAGGDRDRGKRPIMGRAAVQFSDSAVITSDNPRSEDPMAIIDEIVAGVREAEAEGSAVARWAVEPDRRAAIGRAIEGAAPGDVILIAGKGHENYQILKDKTIHFSDVEVAMEMLGK